LGSEEIAYDFSKTTGDTVTIRYYPTDTIVVTVAYDRYVNLFGRLLRQWGFHEQSTQFWVYSLFEVTDSLGLTRFEGEVYGPVYLEGAIINGIQYGTITRLDFANLAVPEAFELYRNHPNPFNAVTNIKFQIIISGFVSLKIYHLLGKEMAVLINERLHAGKYEISWNATQFPSGVYFLKLQAGQSMDVKKMSLIK